MKELKGIPGWGKFCCIFVVFAIGGYLLLANFFHFFSLRTNEEMRLNEKTLQEGETLLEEFSNRNEQLTALTSTPSFSEETVQVIKGYLNETERLIETASYWQETSVSLDDVSVYQYLSDIKEMIPEKEIRDRVLEQLDSKDEDWKEKLEVEFLSYDTYAESELAILKNNDEYSTSFNRDTYWKNTILYSQTYVVRMLETNIWLADLVLEDGGAR